MTETLTFDHVVVGAGTAGALMANRLTADPTRRLLLLEAGGPDNHPWIHIPVGYLYCIGNPKTDWLYQTEPDAGLNGRTLRYPRGKALGGCSSINGMIYMRGQSADYDHWAELLGDESWNWRNVLPYFKAHENYHGGASALHGASGEWRVEKQRLRWEILDAFADAAEQAGIPRTSDFNVGTNEGVGYFEVNQKAVWRWNTAKAFLRPTCVARKNFTLWTRAQVSRLLFETRADGRTACAGVEVVVAGTRRIVKATRGVLLCAGSIGSPQLLQLSGVGPAALLRKHGIDVVRDMPGVGANLQDHLQIRTVYSVNGGRTLNALASTMRGKLSIGLEYLLRRSGPMSMAPSQLGAFTRTSDAYRFPNIEFHVQPLSLDAFGEPLHTYPAITASVCNLRPGSRGTVRIKSRDFLQAPAIAPNYLSTDEDRKVAADSLRVVRRIMTQPALNRYQPSELKPGVQYQTDDDLARLAGDIATTIFHPVGTTKMGLPDDPMAVVDARLRVIGIDNLHVVDAGVMPTITSGNTCSPTLMIAEKAAQWILGDGQGASSRTEPVAESTAA